MPVLIHGLRAFNKACGQADKESKRLWRDIGREVGEPVRAEATRLFSPVDAKSAAGYRVSVTQASIRVVQSLRKTTGKHPEYGKLQMKDALLPALARKENQVVRTWERGTDRICDHFDNA